MSDWLWVGLWGGVGYALSGLLLTVGFCLVMGLYIGVRVVLHITHIKTWRGF
jgi:hypothetical protein